MAKIMKGASLVFGIFFAVTAVACCLWGGELLLSLAITFGVTFYHFFMRLLVGSVVDGVFHNRMPYRAWWFSPRPFEKRLYGFLKVKKWKKRLPTYSPETFSLAHRTLEEVAMATCQAEVVHEIIVVLSFLPLVLALFFGAFPVFFLTSVASALFDSFFVIVQRANRPTIVYLIEKKKNR